MLFRAVDGTVAVLDMIALSLKHFELREDRCLEVLRAGDSVATDLTEHLVINGVPFRQAYRHVGSLVAKQRSRGKRLVDLTAADLTEADLPLSILDHLDPGDSARRRAKRFDG